MAGGAVAGQWEVFIAYPTAERASADELDGHLRAGGASVFVDHRELDLGDLWAARLDEAQRGARITVVLVSSRSDAAFYQRDEIARGIALARRGGHRVVPVYLDDETDPPYGLLALHAARVSEMGGLAVVAGKVLALLRPEDDRTPGPGPEPGSERRVPLPPKGSPFRPGMPLYATDRYPASSRRALLDAVWDDVRRRSNVNLVGERRMGRTSLLNHLYARMLADTGNVATRVNVQDGVDCADAFWGSLLWGVAQGAGGDLIPPARRKELDDAPVAAYGEVRKLLRSLRTRITVVVLVDEFERCFDSLDAFPLPAFFDNLRSLLGGDAQGPYAAAVVATRRPLADYFTTHQVTSVLPTYLPPRQMEGLSTEDAEEVLSQQGRHHLAPGQRDQAAAWAGGHPCRLQCAGEAWYRAVSAGGSSRLAEDEFRRLSAQLCLGAADLAR